MQIGNRDLAQTPGESAAQGPSQKLELETGSTDHFVGDWGRRASYFFFF